MKHLLFAFSILSLGCSVECGTEYIDGVFTDGNMCYNRINREISISNQFSSSEKDMVRQAGTMWNEATNGVVNLTFVDAPDNNADIYVLNINHLYAAAEDDGSIQVDLGYIYEVNQVGLLSGLIAHELGHTFGMGHTNDVEDLMYFQTHSNTYITSADIKHFNNVAAGGVYLK